MIERIVNLLDRIAAHMDMRCIGSGVSADGMRYTLMDEYSAIKAEYEASQKAGGSVPAISLNMQYNVAGRMPYKFHPQASHVSPDWREGWNAALDCVAKHGIPASLGDDTDHKEPK